jgi:hypothetical protein
LQSSPMNEPSLPNDTVLSATSGKVIRAPPSWTAAASCRPASAHGRQLKAIGVILQPQRGMIT